MPQLEPQQTPENASKKSMKVFEITDLSPEVEDQAKRGWNITINGQELDVPITSAKLQNKSMGIDVSYGKRPEGYDGMIITENGGGGSVTIPYMIDDDGNVFIGVVKESRPALGGDTLNVPRGFLDAGETHEQTAVRELAEETGFRAMASRMVQLAQGLNPNSAYFNTSKFDDGVSMFAFRIQPDELELTHDENGKVFYSFPAHVRAQAEQDKIAERILGSEFIPLAQALKSRDMFTSAATGQLLSHLLSEGEYLTPQKLVQESAETL